MIATVRGRLLASDRDGVVIEVGGIGVRVTATAAAQAQAHVDADHVFMHTHLIVREDALTLYGFVTEDERELFLSLVTVAGLGPKSAVAILSAYPSNTVRRAIAAGDADLFTTVTGIGKKLAQRLVVDLRERVSAVAVIAGSVAGTTGDEFYSAREALVGLGFSISEAETGLARTSGPAEDRVRQALAVLGTKP